MPSWRPLEYDADRLAAEGRTPSFVAVDRALAGLVAVADRPTERRPEDKARVVAEERAVAPWRWSATDRRSQ
jgi:cation transport ATPase